MVDGVNFNPFTGKVLTAEEIQKLDENKDGIVSYEELNNNISWISSEQDAEGEVQIDDGTQNNTESQPVEEPEVQLDTRGQNIYNAALSKGAQSSAEDSAQLEEYLTKVESQYIEKVLDESGAAGTSDSGQIVAYLKNQKTEFLNEYVQQHPEGPYDMEAVSASYIQTMDAAFAERQEGVDAFNASIEDKKASAQNFNGLYTGANDVGNYMDPDEYQELKNQSVDYIIGSMLNGEVDDEFLSALNPEYQNNINYINAVNAIKSMQSQSDPVKMQEYLDKAEEAIAKLIGPQNTDGSSNLADAINSKHDAQQTAQYEAKLQSLADEMAEQYSAGIDTRSDAGQKNLDDYTTRLQNAINEFINNYDGTGDIEEQFKEYFEGITSDYQMIQNNIDYMSTRSADGTSKAYDTLVDTVEAAGTYQTEDEKSNIINAAADLFMNSMLIGSDTEAVSQIYPNYETDANYMEAKALYESLGTSATPQEDYEKIKELLTQMLSDYGVDKITDGVKANEAKNVNLSTDIAEGIWGYNTNDTYGGDDIIIPSFNIDENGEVVWTNNNDKGDIEKILQQLEDRIKQQMKEQLGDLYDEAAIEQYFDEAVINNLVNLGSGKTAVYSGDNKFLQKIYDKVNGDGQSVTVETFVNGIIAEFNDVATKALKGENSDNSSIDRLQTLKDSGAVDDYASGENRGGTHWSAGNATNDVKNLAKSKLEMLRSSLITQAQSILGDDYIASDVSTMIDQAINETVDAYEYWDTKNGIRERFAFTASDMYDNFFDNFDKKLEEYKKQKNND